MKTETDDPGRKGMAEKPKESKARLQFFPTVASEDIISHENGHSMDRKRHEEELQEADAKMKKHMAFMKALLAAIPIPVFFKDCEGRYIGCNSAFSDLLGVTQTEIEGKTVHELWPMKKTKAIYEDDLDLLSNPRRLVFETRILDKDGKKRNVVFAKDVFYDDAGNKAGIVGALLDSTELRKVEAEKTLLNSAIEQTAEAVMITDSDGNIEYVNSAFTKITGYWKPEILGRHVRFLQSHEQDRAFYEKVAAAMAEGKTWKGRLVGAKKDRGRFISETSISPVFDKEGKVIHFIGVMHDVTEVVKLEEQYQQAQKMETIGTLAGGIAHDFNNILYAAIGFTELAYKDVPRDGRAAKCLESIMVAHKRASDLVNQILAFSRQSKQERKPIRVQPAVKEAVKLLRKTIPATIEIEQKIDPDCGPILADTTRIHQIVMNLCTNAYHAMEDKGGIMIVRLDSVKVASGRSQSGVELEPGNYVRLEVSDTGVGMDEAVLKRIFEPFYTTKGVGKGTGLGLSTVHGIVKEYGGVVQVRSRPGHGTSFCIFFPGCLEDEKIAPKSSDDPDLKGTEKILFVDDDEMIVAFVERSLRNKGYEIHSRTNGLEALEAFRANPSRYDVVVSDLNMPRMTGVEMAKKMLEIRPGMPIIICTGFSENVNRQAMLDIGISDLLYKPVISKNLLAAIRKAVTQNKERKIPHEANTGD